MSVRDGEIVFEAGSNAALHPGQSAKIIRDGQLIGWIGGLHPQIAQKLGVGKGVYLFELSMNGILAAQVPAFKMLSKFPAIRRDLAVVLDEQISALQLKEVIQQAAPESLTNIELFDVYRGEGIDSGRKSLALGLTLQDLSRTLTDSEVDEAITKIVGNLQTELGAALRD